MILNFVLGTAAELIKVYPIAKIAREDGHEVRFLATGQSAGNFLMQYRDFQLPEADLRWLIQGADLETSSGALRWFARALWAVLKSRRGVVAKDEFVVVHGDTLSTLVGSLYGQRRRLPVVHVEAGLRSRSLLHPFPEEITRRFVSRLVRFHMVPDRVARDNLLRANVRGTIIETGGNTLIDAVFLAPASEQGPLGAYALVNVHRFENLNSKERWQKIVDTLLTASRKIKIVMVMHPPTRHRLLADPDAFESLRQMGVEFHDRLPFAAFIQLVKNAEYLISDGGSNQEECSYLGKPCLLLRLSTERREGLGESCVLSEFIPETIAGFLNDPESFKRAPATSSQSPSRTILEALADK